MGLPALSASRSLRARFPNVDLAENRMRHLFESEFRRVRGILERFGAYEGDGMFQGHAFLVKDDPVVYRLIKSFPPNGLPLSLSAAGDSVEFRCDDANTVVQMDFHNHTLAVRLPHHVNVAVERPHGDPLDESAEAY